MVNECMGFFGCNDRLSTSEVAWEFLSEVVEMLYGDEDVVVFFCTTISKAIFATSCIQKLCTYCEVLICR